GDVGDVPLVACRGHDHDAEVDGVLGGDSRGVARHSERRAEAHVDDVDVIARVEVVVGVERTLDGIGGELGASGDVTEHLVGVELGAWRHALSVPFGSKARGGAGDMRAMPVDVERVAVGARDIDGRVGTGVVVGAGEVEPADHLVGGEGSLLDDPRLVVLVVLGIAGATEGGVGVVDPGVDDCDRHALTVVSVVLGYVTADPGDAVRIVEVVARYPAHVQHAVDGADGGNITGPDLGPDPVGGNLHRGELVD